MKIVKVPYMYILVNLLKQNAVVVYTNFDLIIIIKFIQSILTECSSGIIPAIS